MTQVSLRVVGPTAGDITCTYDLSDTDGARIITAYGKMYGPVEDPVGSGNMRARTPTEIVDKLAQGLIDGVVVTTIHYEQAEAAKNAQQNVPPIPYTPGQ